MLSVNQIQRPIVEMLSGATRAAGRVAHSSARNFVTANSLARMQTTLPTSLTGMRSLSLGSMANTQGLTKGSSGLMASLARTTFDKANGLVDRSNFIRHFQHTTKWPGVYETPSRPDAPELSTRGRLMPEITPQTLGRAMHPDGVVGDWQNARASLVQIFERNLGQLTQVPPDKVEHLGNELTLHWHAMSEVEKVKVLDDVAQIQGSGDGGTPAGLTAPPVQDWLAQRLKVTPQAQLERLQAAASPAAKTGIGIALEKAPTTTPYYNNLAADRMYPYADFLQTAGRIGEAPEGVPPPRIGITGGGPNGLLIAYELMKTGCDVTIFEKTDRLGGRLDATPLSTDVAPGEKPALAETGAMRFPAAQEVYKYYAVEHAASRAAAMRGN